MSITIQQKIQVVKAGYNYSGANLGAIEQENGAVETWDLRGLNSTLDEMMDDEALWGMLCIEYPFLRSVPTSGF